MISRRTFLKLTAGSAALAPRTAWGADKTSAASEAELLTAARERIEQHRKDRLTLVVTGAEGKPLAGAKLKLDQTRHHFLFGCNLFRFGRMPTPELEEAYRRRFAALFNFATLGFYWGFYEREQGKPDYAYTDGAAAWCHEQGLRCKGHPLVWDYTPDPRWLPEGFDAIRTLSLGRVRDIVTRFKGRIDVWDVVNEPTHLGRTKTRLAAWAQSIGAVDYVAEHLRVARAANPDATLLVNDYRTDPPFFAILEALRARRENDRPLFDVVGIQSHMHGGGWPLRRIWEVCDTFGRLGCPLHFTETTIVSGSRLEGERWGATTPEGEAAQADYVPKFYTMLFAHPSVQALTWWDFSDDGAWQRAPAGFTRRDMSPKPVYERLLALIKSDWWTRANGVTDAQGQWSTRAFFGQHRLTVELPDGQRREQEIRWQPGGPARLEIKA